MFVQKSPPLHVLSLHFSGLLELYVMELLLRFSTFAAAAKRRQEMLVEDVADDVIEGVLEDFNRKKSPPQGYGRNNNFAIPGKNYIFK